MMKTTAKHPTREKLLDQGVTMFTEHGYHGAGLQDILNSAGVPKGSFYNYFASKEAFGAASIDHYIDPYITLLDGWLKRPGLDALAALEGYFGELTGELGRRNFAGGCLLGKHFDALHRLCSSLRSQRKELGCKGRIHRIEHHGRF